MHALMNKWPRVSVLTYPLVYIHQKNKTIDLTRPHGKSSEDSRASTA